MAGRIITGLTYGGYGSNPERASLIPARCHPQVSWLWDKWRTMRDLVEGEGALKDAGEKYLPRRTGMDTTEYDAYLQRAVLFNATGKTINDLMVSVFRRPPYVELPKMMQGQLEDPRNLIVTKSGDNIVDLSKELVRELLTVSRYGALLDMNAQGKPYIATYPAETIVNWRVENRKLVAVRLLEPKAAEGYYPEAGKTSSYKVRVLALDQDGNYFQAVGDTETDHVGDPNTIPQSDRVYIEVRGKRLDFIPIVIFNAQGNGPLAFKPMLEDIATLNLAHYRAYAALENARYFTATPIYYVKGQGVANDFGNAKEGGSPQQQFLLTPQSIWLLEQEDEVGLVEFEGKGLSSLEEGLEIKEAQMQALGARLKSQRKNSAARSAQSEESEANAEEATLTDVVENASQGLTQLLQWWAEWILAKPAEVEVVLNKVFYRPKVSAREMRSLQSLFEAGLMPLRSLFEALKSGGFIPEDLTFEAFEAAYAEWKAAKEAEEAAKAAQQAKLNAQKGPRPAL